MKTKIEWCDWTINPIKGLCKHECSYCYAHRIIKRFHMQENISLNLAVFDNLPKKHSRIFVCSMHDIMGYWIPDSWINMILGNIRKHPEHDFLLLSKNPERYNDFRYSDNVWLGATITDDHSYFEACKIKHVSRFVSFEPLFCPMSSFIPRFNWIIVGGLTPNPVHEDKWVDDIVGKCHEMRIPLFLKNNLHYKKEIKQFPTLRVIRDVDNTL